MWRYDVAQELGATLRCWLQDKFPHHMSMSEIAIHISNHTVHKGDRGLIVVGAASHLGDTSAQDSLSAPPSTQLHLSLVAYFRSDDLPTPVVSIP